MTEQKLQAQAYAYIEGGKVREIVRIPDVEVRVVERLDDNLDPVFATRTALVTDVFPPDFVGNLVECGDEVKAGWAYDGVTFSKPAPVQPPAPVDWQDKLRTFLQQNPDVAQGLNQ